MCAQDPNGSYIASWVPELVKLPKKYLHMPWKAPEDALNAAGVSFGPGEGQYPRPHHHRSDAGTASCPMPR